MENGGDRRRYFLHPLAGLRKKVTKKQFYHGNSSQESISELFP